MQRARLCNVLVAVVVVLTSVVGLVAAPAHVAFAKPAAQGVASHDEIILVESTGRIRIDDPRSGVTIWDSGTDVSWMYIAAGDFNGDGDAEIAAIRGNTLKIFDPFPQASSTVVATLDGGKQFRFLVTGDFDRDGRDEIAALHTDTGSLPEVLNIYDGGPTGTTWLVARTEGFGYQWRAMAAGDMNNDGFDDLGLVRQHNNLLKVYSGYNWSTLAESSYNFPWLTLGIGGLSASYAGQEMALTREGRCGSTNIDSLILFRLSSGFFTDLTPDVHYYYCPPFTSLSLGDVDADANHDAEILLLRNPTYNTTSLLLVNPAGPAIRNFELASGYGSTGWSLVRTGDLDTDGKAEVVTLRSNAYRMYMQPDQNNDSQPDVPGSFRIPPSGYDYSTMAIADVGAQVPILQVAPTSLSFDQNTTSGTVAISNLGTGDSIAWQAQVTEGSAWLRVGPPASGNTPAQLRISVDLTAVEPNVTLTGKVQISASGAANSPQTVTVTVRVTDSGLVVTPKALRLVQKAGDPPAEGRVQVTRSGPVAAEWVATAVPTASLASVMAALEGGQAEVTSDGVFLGGEAVPPPAWLVMAPDHDFTPSTMVVRANLPAPGVYSAVVLIVAVDSRVPNRIQGVNVTAEQLLGFSHLPLVIK